MFRRGDRVILEKQVNAIPAGCYKFIDQAGEMLIFSVGSRVQVGLSLDCMPLLKKVSGTTPLTRPEEFIPRYYELLREIRFQKFRPEGPFSFCGVDARSPLVRQFESSFPFETRQ